MKKIFVIAIDEFGGYEENSTNEIINTNVLVHFGGWNDETSANLKCVELNAKETESNEENPFYVLEIKINE